MLHNRLLRSHVLFPCCKGRGCVKTPPADPAAGTSGFPGDYVFWEARALTQGEQNKISWGLLEAARMKAVRRTQARGRRTAF